MITNPRNIYFFLAVFSAIKDSPLHCFGFLRQACVTTLVVTLAWRIKGACTKRCLTITCTEFSFETCSVLGIQSLNEEPGFLQECARSEGRLTMQGLRTCCCEVPGVPPAACAAPQLRPGHRQPRCASPLGPRCSHCLTECVANR